MAQFTNKIEKPGEKEPREEMVREEVVREWFPEGKEEVERKKLTEEEKEERKKFKEEIKKVKLPHEKRLEAQKEADTLREETVKGKVSHLLDLARTKGVVFADRVARESKNPLIIDLFHDILAKNGLFKKFPK